MAEAKSNAALDRLIELRAEVESRLQDNEDYRTLVALTRAIAEIAGAGPTIEAPAINGTGVRKPPAVATPEIAGLSQPDAAYVLLTQVLHEPVIIANLVKALNAHGVSVGGINPNINLSSVLSKDGRFRSVRFKDRSSWWVKGRPFPGELDAP